MNVKWADVKEDYARKDAEIAKLQAHIAELKKRHKDRCLQDILGAIPW